MTPCKRAVLEMSYCYTHFDELMLTDDFGLAEIIPACRELALVGELRRVNGGFKITELGRKKIMMEAKLSGIPHAPDGGGTNNQHKKDE